MKQLLFFVIFLWSNTSGFSSSYNEWWQKANKFYKQKEYDSAADYYERIAKQKPEEAIIYYNLGNTYYKLNEIGKAVLNYERALKIEPSYKEAEDNLTLTQSRINNRIQSIPEIFFVRWWDALTARHRAGMWAAASLILFLVFMGSLVAKRLGKAQNMPSQLIAGIFCIWLFSAFVAFLSARNKATSTHAVVMQPDTPFMAQPAYGKAQSLIPEGTTIEWKDENKGWVEVKLPDGRRGWIEKNALAKI